MKKQQGGFIKVIIVVIIVLVALVYFGVDLKKIASSPIVAKIFSLIWTVLTFVIKLLVGLIQGAWGTIVKIFEVIAHFISNLKTS